MNSTGSGPARPSRPTAPEDIDLVSALIRKLDGFAPLTEPERAALVGLARHIRTVERHTILVEQADVADHAVVVSSGFASRYKRRASGRRQILAYLIPGDFCDRGALHGYSLDHTIETLTRRRIARVPRAVYLELISQHPGIARALQRAKLAEEATAREWMANIGMRSVRVPHRRVGERPDALLPRAMAIHRNGVVLQITGFTPQRSPPRRTESLNIYDAHCSIRRPDPVYMRRDPDARNV